MYGYSSNLYTIQTFFRIIAHGPYGHSKTPNFLKNSLIGPFGFISNIEEYQKKIRPVL